MSPKVKAAIAAAAIALGGTTYAVAKKHASAEHDHHQAQFEAGYEDPMLRHRK